MTLPAPLTLLLANLHPEEIQRTTIRMREFYPGCRVEAVFSAEEVLEWALKQVWHVIVLDERIPPRGGLDILPELRQRTPDSVIILQGERSDSRIAGEALRAGADCYLSKRSPTFLLDLPLAARNVLEKRELHRQLDSSRRRHRQLTEILPDVVYELDSSGRFLSVSQAIFPLLGYDPQELIGVHFSTLVPQAHQGLAMRRLNERRTGLRSTRGLQLALVAKPVPGAQPAIVHVELTATGLYEKQQFAGTIGTFRSIGGVQQHAPDAQDASEPRLDLEQVQEQAHALAPLIKEFGTSLANFLRNMPQGRYKNHVLPLETRPKHAATELASTMKFPQPERPLATSPKTDAGLLPPNAHTPTPPPIPYFPRAAERRRTQRIPLKAKARLSLGTRNWQGTSLNISLGGVRLMFNEAIPAFEQQPAHIHIHFDASVLELPGMVQRIGEASALSTVPEVGSAFMFVVAFFQLETTEEMVFAQLLEEIPRQTLSIELVGFLSLPQDAGEKQVTTRTAAILTTRSEPERGKLADGRAVWKDYLAHSTCLANFPDYWQTLAQIFRLAGTRRGGDRILDAGCGTGLAGAFLLVNEAYRVRSTPRGQSQPLHYVGVDFVANAILQARRDLSRMAAELSAQFTGIAPLEPLMKLSFGVADLNLTLPFQENSFERIVCNFVVNYLENPELSLRELVRVLRPGGTLVVTALKPLADLSEIQRNLFPMIEQPNMVKQAMKLLSLWSKIEQGATPAHIRPIDEHELTTLLLSSGAQCPRMYHAFASQALLAVAERADHSSPRSS